ncbi:hypothetical protein ACIQVT_26275 [Streptomyces sp. NPDC100445]|uniref:hypothetical protein n=1 Tax=Streptomyces sp. NPDC100445 TaxID=3366102 RepID=UPI00380BD37E
MATKTTEGAEPGTGARADDETTAAAGTAGAAGTPTDQEAGERGAEVPDPDTAPSEEDGDEAREVEAADRTASGVGLGAGAVVSAALGLVSLSGGWIGTVAAAREQLVGQLRTSSTATVSRQIKEVYGDAWHTTALWAGLFALTALVTGVVVLARPAFGAPGRPQAAWIRSVAWAGVSLGVIGLLLAVLKYSDALLGLPSAG